MNKTLNIVIIDDDKFYTIGLTAVLALYLKSKGMNAEFSYNHNSGIIADIVFQAIHCNTFIKPYNSLFTNYKKPLCVTIITKQHPHLKHLDLNVDESKVLYRHQPVSLILQVMENCLHSLHKPPVTFHPTLDTVNALLTKREFEVLHQLRKGKNPSSIARFLAIKEKTVSSHKRSAMRKLNFKRTNELLLWMIEGGLN